MSFITFIKSMNNPSLTKLMDKHVPTAIKEFKLQVPEREKVKSSVISTLNSTAKLINSKDVTANKQIKDSIAFTSKRLKYIKDNKQFKEITKEIEAKALESKSEIERFATSATKQLPSAGVTAVARESKSKLQGLSSTFANQVEQATHNSKSKFKEMKSSVKDLTKNVERKAYNSSSNLTNIAKTATKNTAETIGSIAEKSTAKINISVSNIAENVTNSATTATKSTSEIISTSAKKVVNETIDEGAKHFQWKKVVKYFWVWSLSIAFVSALGTGIAAEMGKGVSGNEALVSLEWIDEMKVKLLGESGGKEGK